MLSRTVLVLAPLALLAPRTDSPRPTTPADDELAWALSAAPAHVRGGAGAYVLAEAGYELTRASSNGFHCLVERWTTDGAPVCYDRVGSESTLLVVLHLEARRAEGIPLEVVEAEIEEGYATGRFVAPAGPGIAYMLSKNSPAPPHVMYYAPYATNAEFAGAEEGARSVLPFVYGEGGPRAYFIQLVDPEALAEVGG